MHQLSLRWILGLRPFKVLPHVDVINLFCSIFQEKRNVPKLVSGKVVMKDHERLSVALTSPSKVPRWQTLGHQQRVPAFFPARWTNSGDPDP